MTTFTMQDLTNAVPTTHQQDEEFKQMENIGLKELLLDHLNTPEVPRETKEVLQGIVENRSITKEEFMEYGMNNPLSTSVLTGGKTNVFDAPVPQPTNNPDIPTIINAICAQLELLSTIISQSQAETKAGENSLQETVGLVLQQADWFKDLIRVELVALDLEKIAEGAVESIVENEVESYFENRFDPSDHFDFDDATHDAVGDRIDDVVSDKIDDAVDAYLSNATISISK
jgi:hypothetical protein